MSRGEFVPGARDENPEEEEDGQVQRLPPLLGELHAVRAGFREVPLDEQPGDDGGDEHAGADGLGSQRAENRERHQAQLRGGSRHPRRAPRPSQQQPARPSDADPDQRSEAELLEDSSLRLIASAPVPCARGPLGLRVIAHAKDYFADKPPFTTLEQLQAARTATQHANLKYAVY